MHRIIMIVFLGFLAACSEEKPMPVIYEDLQPTYVSHRYKDKLTTSQLLSKLRLFVPGADSFVHPKYDVTAYRIFYKTHDFRNNEIIASGLVYVPEITNHFLPVVCYQHGTSFKKTEVSSISGDFGYYIPFIMASETGTLVCAADYIGLGFSEGVQHYHEPTEEANAVVDMLGSVQVLINNTNGSLTFDNDVFLVGYSQGGHATLATQRKLETRYPHQFQVKASAPMGGWFALEKSTQLDVLKDSVSFPFSGAYAFLINSVQTTQQVFPSFSDFFIPPYDSLTNVSFDGEHSIGAVNAQFPANLFSVLQPAFRNDLKNNTDNPFMQAVRKYDVINDWIPKTPTRFYHSEGDEISFYDNSVIAFNTFKRKGGNVELFSLGTVSHFDANVLAIERVRDWFYPMIRITPY